MAKHEHEEHDTDVIDRPPQDEPAPLPVFEYDAPPKEWVAGTVVPEDTAPEDMTDAEYIQWMYDNLTPFWAIKRNMLLRRRAGAKSRSSRRRRGLGTRVLR